MEPQRPLIGGQISGLTGNILFTIHITTPEGREAVYHTQRGNGRWRAVVTKASGLDYIVTASAEGYVSSPISYTISISGTAAYLVDAGQMTSNEASQLDFNFTSP